MNDYIYLVFSDGTWSAVNKNSNRLSSVEDRIQKQIDNHYWRFPLDIKGDSRRTVTILRDVNNVQYMEGI